jgi:sensor histidine kinase regulating citrate/malate metabolism
MTIEAVALVVGVALVCTRVAWHVRGRIDAAEMNMLANTISQAIDDRQTAINQTAIADALLATFTARYTTQIDDELQQLLDEER